MRPGLLGPARPGLHLVASALLLILSACGGSKSPTAPSGGSPQPSPTTGRLTISNLTASGTGAPGGKTYTISMRLSEAGGRGVTISSIVLALDNNGRGTVPGDNTKIPANGALNAGPITLTDSSQSPVSTSVAVTVNYTDDGGTAGTANASTSVTVIVMVTMAGTVRDAASGAPIANATVRVTTGPSQGVTATSNASGQYELSPIQAGSFNIFVSAAGYDGKTFPIAIDRNTPFDPAISKTPPDVEYTITGTAQTCDATYENSTGGTDQREVRSPFSYSWSGARSGAFLYMSCQINRASDRGSITVRILRRGITLQSATAVGFPNIATASGSY